MSSISIDFRNDPEVPLGREMFEHLAGAHMAAESERELEILVRHSMDEVMSSDPESLIRLLTHAMYRGQALVVRLVTLATQQRMALEDAHIEVPPGQRHRENDRFVGARIDLWAEVRDDINYAHG